MYQTAANVVPKNRYTHQWIPNPIQWNWKMATANLGRKSISTILNKIKLSQTESSLHWQTLSCTCVVYKILIKKIPEGEESEKRTRNDCWVVFFVRLPFRLLSFYCTLHVSFIVIWCEVLLLSMALVNDSYKNECSIWISWLVSSLPCIPGRCSQAITEVSCHQTYIA